MTPAARLQAVIDLYGQAREGGRPADAVASAFFRGRRYIGSKDRQAVAGRLWSMLRHEARLGWWVARAGVPDTPRTRAAAELLIAEGMAGAAVDKLFDGSTYGPAPLAAEERAILTTAEGGRLDAPEMPDGVRAELPDWAVAPMRRAFGDRFDEEAAALLEAAPLDLRVNEIKARRDEVLAALEAQGVEAAATALSPIGVRVEGRPNLAGAPLFKSGAIEIQDEGSQLVALLADARPGMQIADYCAGAGGKALALAARMGGKGRVLACDVSEGRLARAKERMRRAGIDNIEPRLIAPGDKRLKRLKGRFDRVLVDAPCSGTGAWRRNPDARWRDVDLDALTALQADLLDRAARLVKPGGRLVYATCSVLAEENEDRVEAFLADHPDFAALPVAEAWAGVFGEDAAPPAGADAGRWLRLSPARHGTDGFFVAILARAEAGRGAGPDGEDGEGESESEDGGDGARGSGADPSATGTSEAA
ncbi:MAG: RsmB/NOP family class I SAM-dependent RNA methyltransferase [Azospirillaceae bacterium]